MAHEVFISYSTPDKSAADAVCAILESRSIRCWIARRDVVSGDERAAAIMDAITDAKLMVVVFSAHANDSQQVMREVERAVAEGLVIVPFRLEDIAFSKTLTYFLSTCHWLDALTPPLENHINRLADTVTLFLNNDDGAVESTITSQKNAQIEKLLEQERSARSSLNMDRQQLAICAQEQDEHPERFMQDQIEIFEDDIRKHEQKLKEIRKDLRRLRH